MIIDFHTHIFSPDVCKNRENYLKDNHFSLLNENPKSIIIDGENLHSSMKKEMVDYSVVMGFPWINEEFASLQNIYFSKIKKNYDNIFPFGTVPLNYKKPISETVKEIYDLGLYGIGEIAFYENGFSEKEAIFLDELLKNAAIFSLPVNIHLNEPIGHNYTGKYAPNFKLLTNVIKQNPDNIIILSHWGGGIFIYELMPEIKDQFKNVFYDTAASPFLFDKKIYKSAIDIVGKDKILFGTDFPLLKPKRYIKEIEISNLTKNEKESILFNNSARILNLN